MALVLGAAFGPQATHVEVRDADTGALVASGAAQHAELGPDHEDPTGWWRSLATAVGRTGERDIAAMSVCGSHPGLVLLDGAGAVLRPMQPWDDAAAAVDAARLRKGMSTDAWVRRAGALPSAATAISRLAWLRRTDLAIYARIGAALLPHDWLTYRLSSRMVTDRASASLTGAWSPAQESWLGEVLDLLEPHGAATWRDRLPEVLGPSDEADWLTAPVFELLGLRGRPLVGPGTGEPMAVALALGIRPGRVGISLGHHTTVLTGVDRPVADSTGAVRSRADAAGGHLATSTVGGGLTLVGALAEVLACNLDELGRLALATPPSSDGPVIVPEVPGRPGAVLTGLVAGATRGQLARAAFEATACAALDAVDAAGAAGARPDEDEPLLLVAPGPAGPVHAQVLADLAAQPVRAVTSAPLAAAGACVQAASVLRRLPPLEVSDDWALVGDAWSEPADDVGRIERRHVHTAEQARQRRALRQD